MASSPTNPVPSQGPQYNVVALISGGKDSFFSLLHCLANGHNLVALANLHPPPSAPSEELDSYMYQTVGHRLVPLYEQALGVPLYRCVIRGGTGTGDRDYVHQPSQEGTEEGTREDDETEDLIPLLKRVLAKHPEVNAICTGAILSTYQRTRIESIALRLRLTPLAFLWQYPSLPPYDQAGLLADMASVGQDSRIVKVASAGLSEHAFLWRNVADHTTIARMKNAMSRFAVNGDGCVLGEGGEYETLTLDGPRVLWKGRVVVEGTDGYVVDGGKEVEGRVVMKSEDEEAKKGFEGLRIPSLWDDEFKRVLQSDALLDSSSSSSSSSDDNEELPSTEQPPLPTSKTFASLPPSTPSLSPSGTIFTYPNITAPPTSSSPTTPESQLTTIFALLSSALATHALPKSQITHCTLLLRHMSTFTSINATYASFFSFTNPPSRATVAIGSLMPEGVDVMLSVIAHRLPSSSSSSSVQREGLHVQSQSYWAPANIGPYSQAISVPLFPCPSPTSSSPHHQDHHQQQQQHPSTTIKEVHIAGQIPLIPSSLTLLSSSSSSSLSTPITTTSPPQTPPSLFAQSTLLSLQHLTRISRSVGVVRWTAGVALIPRDAPDDEQEDYRAVQKRVRIISKAWRAVHTHTHARARDEDEDEDEEDIDVWDRLNRGATTTFDEKTKRREVPGVVVATVAPSSSTTKTTTKMVIPPLYIAQISSLPRDAEIEWCCSGITSTTSSTSSSSDTTSTPSVQISSSSFSSSSYSLGSTTRTGTGIGTGTRTTRTTRMVVNCDDGGNGGGNGSGKATTTTTYITREIPLPPPPSTSSYSQSSTTTTITDTTTITSTNTNDNKKKKKNDDDDEMKLMYGTLYTSSSSPPHQQNQQTRMGNVQIVPCYRVWRGCGGGSISGEDEDGDGVRVVGGVVVGRI